MKIQFSGFTSGVFVGAAVTAAAFAGPGLFASGATEQAPPKVQATSKVVLENARVRVKDVTFPPGVTPMHTHDLPHVGVVIQGGTLVFKSPDGKTETAKLEAGGVGFREAKVSHEPTNTGTSPVRVIEVELK